MEQILDVKGMNCGHCVASVKRALEGVAGVTAVAVSLDAAEATVTHDGAEAQALVDAVTDAGFLATVRE
jgi:Cu+-exporting ATPase